MTSLMQTKNLVELNRASWNTVLIRSSREDDGFFYCGLVVEKSSWSTYKISCHESALILEHVRLFGPLKITASFPSAVFAGVVRAVNNEPGLMLELYEEISAHEKSGILIVPHT